MPLRPYPITCQYSANNKAHMATTQASNAMRNANGASRNSINSSPIIQTLKKAKPSMTELTVR